MSSEIKKILEDIDKLKERVLLLESREKNSIQSENSAQSALEQFRGKIINSLTGDLAPFRDGILFLVSPITKKKYSLPELQEKINDAIVEEEDLSFPWDKLAPPDQTPDETEIFSMSSLENRIFLEMFGWHYSFANKHGAVGIFSSYFEDRNPKNTRKYFDIYRVLRRSLLFLKFCQKYMKNLEVEEVRIDFLATGTKDRIFKPFPNTFQAHDYEYKGEEIYFPFILNQKDLIFDKIKKLANDIGRVFNFSSHYLVQIRSNLYAYYKDLIFKHEIS